VKFSLVSASISMMKQRDFLISELQNRQLQIAAPPTPTTTQIASSAPAATTTKNNTDLSSLIDQTTRIETGVRSIDTQLKNPTPNTDLPVALSLLREISCGVARVSSDVTFLRACEPPQAPASYQETAEIRELRLAVRNNTNQTTHLAAAVSKMAGALTSLISTRDTEIATLHANLMDVQHDNARLRVAAASLPTPTSTQKENTPQQTPQNLFGNYLGSLSRQPQNSWN